MTLLERIAARLSFLYGNANAQPKLLAMVETLRARLSPARARRALTQRDLVIIAYPDHLQRDGEPPLATLERFLDERLTGCASAVHVLPFHPSTSYEGYSISDYFSVDPQFGTWPDIENVARRHELMIDLVLNHCSASHPWFAQFKRDEEPGRRYFVTVDDPQEAWLRGVYRARTSPLLHPFETTRGVRHVWTTYSDDLIDLNFREPDVLLEMIHALLDAVAHGATIVRLDAFVYVWKCPGTTCINQPEGHEIVRLLQDVLELAGRPDVLILPSITNVSQAENFRYLDGREGRKADLIYHLPLSSLLLQALYEGDATTLSRWLRELPQAPAGSAYLNLAASHDGIGLTWLEGVIPNDAIARLIDTSVKNGSLLSSRKRTVEGDMNPWEINATYFSACGSDPAALLLTQSVVLALRGVPALYLPLFLAAPNDHERVARTGDNRAINRARFDIAAWERAREDSASNEARVHRGLTTMARARRAHPAFAPDEPQEIVDVSPHVLAIRRGPLLCLANFSARPVRVELPPSHRTDRVFDMLARDARATPANVLGPHQARWLVPAG